MGGGGRKWTTGAKKMGGRLGQRQKMGGRGRRRRRMGVGGRKWAAEGGKGCRRTIEVENRWWGLKTAIRS